MTPEAKAKKATTGNRIHLSEQNHMAYMEGMDQISIRYQGQGHERRWRAMMTKVYTASGCAGCTGS